MYRLQMVFDLLNKSKELQPTKAIELVTKLFDNIPKYQIDIVVSSVEWINWNVHFKDYLRLNPFCYEQKDNVIID